MEITEKAVRCSIQVALLGAVTNNLRAVSAIVSKKEINLKFLYENQPSENEIELSQIASTEIFSDFGDVIVNEQQIVLNKSNIIPLASEEMLLYHRYENNFIVKDKKKYTDLSVSSLRIAMQYALIGMVTRNLRKVSITNTEKNIALSFFYDKEPSADEVNLSEIVFNDFVSSFEKHAGVVNRFVIPEPERIPYKESDILVYSRCEDHFEDD